MNAYEHIKVTEADRAAYLNLARPPLNVLNIAMISEINQYLESLLERTDLCVLVIRGEGKHFCAGVDIPEHKQDTVATMLGTFHQMFRLLNRLPMPTLCVVHGGVYGGGAELAMFCDVVLGADDLKIGVPEITLGVFPPLAIAHLTKLVGVHRAAELIYTGAVIDGAEAQRIGLVNHLVPAAEVAEATDKWTRRFTKLSAFSLRHAREAFRSVVMSDFEQALEGAERGYLDKLMAGQDPVEGLEAFMNKRVPSWNDR